MLLHQRDPYSPEITVEIQIGYYGRTIDAARPNDPTNQQAFAYPVYVAFLLAPSVKLPFSEVQVLFRWLLAGLTALSVLLWLHVIGLRLSWVPATMVVLLVFGTFPVVQGIKLQQLSLLVAALIAGSVGGLAHAGSKETKRCAKSDSRRDVNLSVTVTYFNVVANSERHA